MFYIINFYRSIQMAPFNPNLCKGKPACFCSLFISTHWVVLFNIFPRGLKLLGGVICLSCCTGWRETLAMLRRVWTDLSVAGVPAANSWSLPQPQPNSCPQHSFQLIWVHSCWVSCWFVLQFAALILVKKHCGRLWVVKGMHGKTSRCCFLTCS